MVFGVCGARQSEARRALGSVEDLRGGLGRSEPSGDSCQFRLFMGASVEIDVCGVEEEKRE